MNSSLITIENISKSVQGRTILSDVSFTIEKKSLISVIGPNGAGKSTLLKILLGFDTEYTGLVSIHPDERIAYIPQINASDSHPIALSVREYIAVGTSRLYSKKGTYKLDLDQILQHVGVSSSALEQSFWSLSGGERQRVAIARALLTDPTILVLDEPLSAVDYSSRTSLYELLRHLQQDHDITVILVSHDVDSVLPISDRVLCLNQTLHTDCHPCDYSDVSFSRIHHHC